MEKVLQPTRLDIDPSAPSAAKEWRHWSRTFKNFIEECGDKAPDKFRTLINCVTHNVFEYIEDCKNYDSAISTLEKLYVKTPNEIFARHLLATRQQKPGESLDEFLRELRKLSKDCNVKAVSAEQYREELIRDVFINGIASPLIRQRLLENATLSLQGAYEKAYTLDLAQRNADAYTLQTAHTAAVVASRTPEDPPTATTEGEIQEMLASSEKSAVAATYSNTRKCFFCGGPYHGRNRCPAREANCNKCAKKGHFARVCKSGEFKSRVSSGLVATTFNSHILATLTNVPQGLSKAATFATINGRKVSALMDSCSTDSYIDEQVAQELGLEVHKTSKGISLAQKSLTTSSPGFVIVDLQLSPSDQPYPGTQLGIMKDLCSDLILGQDFQRMHLSVKFEYGGPRPELTLKGDEAYCALAAATLDQPSLFPNLSPNCKPIASRSRRFSKDDQEFIGEEVDRLLTEGIIETCVSPWRAQVVVVKDPTHRHKKRMCIDYSQTINQYTELDAYPLPRIDEMVDNLAKYSVFSTFDLKSAYHQIPLKDTERKYTAFEANGCLYQFCRVPFGVTNGVAVFQRAMDKLIKDENLQGAFPYLDNITIAGHTQEEHDRNVQHFLNVVSQRNFTLNESKTVKSASSISVLGYCVGKGVIRPDPERLRPLQQLPAPTNAGSLKRTLGMFAYYAKWIQNFSQKIQPLVNTRKFPLDERALKAFDELKMELEAATLHSVDENLPFEVECDASDVAVSAVLNQGGRPVAFMSRTLQGSELHYHIVEKEATAIIEAVRKWSHFLARRHFNLVTDQRSVAFMFDTRKRTKIKNNKIQEWRMELAAFSYTIRYRPGKENVVPDTLTRAFCCSAFASSTLTDLHKGLCHPGVTRLLHFVRTKNLPFSTEDVKRTCASCRICADLKPRFYNPAEGRLIKATQPMERLSIDFKGPLPTASRNPYMLTVIDEYSRFPFAFPCPNMNTSTVIRCLEQIFSLCGMPQYVHSDQGTSFMSKDLKDYLSQKGVATSRTTPYHPTGNSQVERFNGIVWKSIKLALKSHSLPDSHWDLVLPDVLHSLRSLLCTSTNTTPHERFFAFQRRSTHGNSLPSWLMSPGPVLLRRFVRGSKHDPLVDQVELLDCNPTYATVRYSDGRESTVSVRDLAQCPETLTTQETSHKEPVSTHLTPVVPNIENQASMQEETTVDSVQHLNCENETLSEMRKSTRVSKPPERYGWD